MATSAEILAKIAQIDALLESGVDSHAVDGTQTHYDLESLRKQRSDLVDELGGARKKQRCTAVRLDG